MTDAPGSIGGRETAMATIHQRIALAA